MDLSVPLCFNSVETYLPEFKKSKIEGAPHRMLCVVPFEIQIIIHNQ